MLSVDTNSLRHLLDDQARIATWSLITPTDRFKKNYSIDLHPSNKIAIQATVQVAAYKPIDREPSDF